MSEGRVCDFTMHVLHGPPWSSMVLRDLTQQGSGQTLSAVIGPDFGATLRSIRLQLISHLTAAMQQSREGFGEVICTLIRDSTKSRKSSIHQST